jgi:predicted ester cyclase
MMSATTRLATAVMSLMLASGAMAQSPEAALEARNEAIIRRHHDAINAGDVAAAAAFYADTVRNNGNVVDRARLFAIMRDNARTFPDWRMTIDRLIARGDQVVVLMTVTGTHRGVSQRPVNGGVYLGVAPTGRSFSVLHTHWFTLRDGLIVEHRATRDDLGMSRQLGLQPPAPPRPPNE